MIEAIITGKLRQRAEEITGNYGKRYVKARIRVAVADGESITLALLAFEARSARDLLELEEGTPLSVIGTLRPYAWIGDDKQARPGGDITVSKVMALAQKAAKPRQKAQRDLRGMGQPGDEEKAPWEA